MQPIISVITVTYNAELLLEGTIQSIIQQTYPNIEYVVVDGASKDTTVQIIEKYAQMGKINTWISEKDNGLYDAMNKAIRLAKGDYIIFMNAGDSFYGNNTLENIFKNTIEKSKNSENADIYYGDAQILEDGTHKILGLRSQITPHKLPKSLSWRSMRMGMVVCHQAFIVKRSIAGFYDTNYQLSADIDWVIRCLKKSTQVIDTKQIICNFIQGGLTTQRRKKSLSERYEILKKHFGIFANWLNHVSIALRGLFFILKQRKKYWD
jgi:glycosyltransferase involved in cell wall biosynthesis